MKYEQIWKKFFPPKKHTYAKESIVSKVVYFLVFIFYSYYFYYHYCWSG